MKNNNLKFLHNDIEKTLAKLICRKSEKIPYPFLSVSYGKFYSNMIYVWDCHHMAIRMAYAGKTEFLRYLLDNVFYYQYDNGFTPNCICGTNGPVHRSPKFHAQPFLAQGAYLFAKLSKNLEWLNSVFDNLEKYLRYYEAAMSAPNGLFRWPLTYIGGFDNDVATNFFQPDTVVSVDLSSWLVREYRAMADIAVLLNQKDFYSKYKKKAEKLSKLVNDLLWNEKAGSYAGLDLCSGRHVFSLGDSCNDHDDTGMEEVGKYAFHSASNLIPLYAGIADREKAKTVIERYMLSEKHFLSPYGIRSLSKASEFYNNAVWGNAPRYGDHTRLTNSNWQGPIWAPLCIFMSQALKFYGYDEEAKDISDRTVMTMANSIRKVGSMAENFHAETGEPLYGRKFASWNILTDIMHELLEQPDWLAPVYHENIK